MAERLVAERFLLLEPLGRGGMGTVWRARDQVLDRFVALKEVSLPSSVPEPERAAMRERVLREARAAARLNHSSAVTVFDVIEEDDNIFIAMEMVESPTLADIVRQEGPLAPPRAASIAVDLLDALQTAHSKGIVHRDVKPANVMVSDHQVKLADFGIASVKGDPQITATGLLLGSPSYMSPEQAAGNKAGPASDLWGLGATLYFAVEGKGPFDREGPLPTLMAITNEEAPVAEHAGALGPVIKSLLDKDPDDRPEPPELSTMLERIAGAEHPEPMATLAAIEENETTWEEELSDLPATLRVESAPKAAPAPPVAPVRLADPDPPAARTRPATPEPDLPVGRWALWALAGGLLLLAMLLLLPRLFDSPGDDGAGVAAPEATGAAGGQAAGGGAENEEDSEPPAGTDSGRQAPAAPDGWTTAALGDTGYQIAHPESWSVRGNVLGDGSSTRFQGPDGRYLLVDWTGDPGDDALAAWEQQSKSFAQRHEGYEEVRLETTEFQDFPTAAVWEWTYTEGGARLHAIDLGFADDSYGFALNFQTRAGDWEESQDTFESFKDTFGKR